MAESSLPLHLQLHFHFFSILILSLPSLPFISNVSSPASSPSNSSSVRRQDSRTPGKLDGTDSVLVSNRAAEAAGAGSASGSFILTTDSFNRQLTSQSQASTWASARLDHRDSTIATRLEQGISARAAALIGSPATTVPHGKGGTTRS